MSDINPNRKEVFLELLTSWKVRKMLYNDYLGATISISQLASLIGISKIELKVKFNSLQTLASEGFEFREGFFAAKIDSGYQVSAQLNGRQKISEFTSEAEATDFFLNIFASTEPLIGFESAIQDIFIDFSLREFSQYIHDPMLFSSVKDRAAYVGIEEEKMKSVVKSRYIKTPRPYSIVLKDDRGLEETLTFNTEDELIDYYLR